MREVITTSIYRLSPNVFTHVVTKRRLTDYWWIPAIPIIVFIILGATIHPAFLYVALMTGFLIFPTALMMVYFSDALSRDGMLHSLPCQAMIHPDGRIRLCRFSKESDEKYPDIIAEENFNQEDIYKIEETNRHIIITVKHKRYAPKFVALEAFESEKDIENALNCLRP